MTEPLNGHNTISVKRVYKKKMNPQAKLKDTRRDLWSKDINRILRLTIIRCFASIV
jgi:hypothetical protein